MEQEHRRALEQAWFVAALGGWKKVPKLKKFMRDCFPVKNRPQSPDELRAAILSFAAECGIKITRHDKPVM